MGRVAWDARRYTGEYTGVQGHRFGPQTSELYFKVNDKLAVILQAGGGTWLQSLGNDSGTFKISCISTNSSS